MTDQIEARTAQLPPRVGNGVIVFDIIHGAKGPLSACDILDRLKPGRPRISLPAIYRALKHPISGGPARRVKAMNAEVRALRSVVFASCDRCGRVQQRDAGAEVARLTKALARDGFRPAHPMVEVHDCGGDCDATGAGA